LLLTDIVTAIHVIPLHTLTEIVEISLREWVFERPLHADEINDSRDKMCARTAVNRLQSTSEKLYAERRQI